MTAEYWPPESSWVMTVCRSSGVPALATSLKVWRRPSPWLKPYIGGTMHSKDRISPLESFEENNFIPVSFSFLFYLFITVPKVMPLMIQDKIPVISASPRQGPAGAQKTQKIVAFALQ